MDKIRRKKLINLETGLVLAAIGLVTLLHALFMALSGKTLLDENSFNSYVLQACSWLEGRLSLKENYSWLELAVYNGQYYVSFPPFPSYLLLPFAAVFGEDAPDGLLAFGSLLVGVAYGVRLARHFGVSAPASVALPVFLFCGNNLMQVTVDAWVWFLAQNMAFTLTLAAFYHGAKGSKGLAALLLVAAAGCRPFQALYTPVVCWLLLYAHCGKKDGKPDWKGLFLRKNWQLIPAVLLGASYLVLNMLRFGSFLEFGHNYLPEFVEAEHGQFSTSYWAENLPTLLRMPEIDAGTGQWVFPMFNGCNIFLVDPILMLALAAGIWAWVDWAKKRIRPTVRALAPLGAVALMVLHVLILCAHKTMGGAHFGNRYIIDILPVVYLCLCGTLGREMPALKKVALWVLGSALFLFGFYINFTGTMTFYGAL